MRLSDGAAAERSSSRHLPLGWLAVAGALLLGSVGVKTYHVWHPPTLPSLVEWVDFERATKMAREQDKLVLYDFTATWCGPCKKMKKELFSVEGYAQKINDQFVPVQIYDTDEGKEIDKLRKRFEVEAYPTLVIASADGKRFKMTRGYRAAAMTASWLKRTAKELREGTK